MCSSIPVYVVSFNNATYVRNMVESILRRRLTDTVIVVDNCTTHPPCLQILQKLEAVPGVSIIRMPKNMGHTVIFSLPNLPDRCVITDPDLGLNPDIPENALCVLSSIADKYKAARVGLCIDISEPEKFRTVKTYNGEASFYNWESQFWKTPIQTDDISLPAMYWAQIDTTFFLYTKHYFPEKHIRVAGLYTCKHLPWYSPPLLHIPAEEIEAYHNGALRSSSTTVSAELFEGTSYVEDTSSTAVRVKLFEETETETAGDTYCYNSYRQSSSSAAVTTTLVVVTAALLVGAGLLAYMVVLERKNR